MEDIASGSATIDSEYTRQMISAFSRYLFAVETEAAAALEAFQSRHPSLPSILIRGISDPSASKSESDAVGDGAWRRYAARNAAKLLVYLLSIYKIPTIEADSLLPPSDNVYSDKELSRLRQVFAPPNIYDKAKDTLTSENRLVIIKGPGGIGKTTTGINLLLDIQERYTGVSKQVLTPQPTVRSLRHLAQLRDTLILLDAPFGVRDIYEPIDLSFPAHFDQLLDISKNNWVVITTRSEPLERAAEIIERRDLQRYMISLSEDAYDDDALRLILKNHIRYYLNHGHITQWVAEYVSDRDKTRWIIRNLRFPHNIARFVRDELPEVTDQETLKSALDRAKDTKQAAMLYFRKLDGEYKYFMFSVALFCDLFNNDTFSRILSSLFSAYSVPQTNLNVPLLRQKTRYIRQWGRVGFEHQDYFDGIVEAVADPIFDEDIRRLSDLLANLSEDADVEVRRSLWFPLKELSRVDPEAGAGIVFKLLRSDDDRVRESAYIPLRMLVKHDFEKVQSYLEQIVVIDQAQKSNPNYKGILFRKAIREHILGPYIERGDAQGIFDLSNVFEHDLKIHIYTVIKLYQVYKKDKQKAMTFFSKWWKRDPHISLTSLQDFGMSRNITTPRAEFIADALGQIPRPDAFAAIIDWSTTESKRDDFRKNLIRVIAACLQQLSKTSPGDVDTLVTEWETSGNDLQRRTVRLFRHGGTRSVNF